MHAAEIRARLERGRGRLLEVAHRLPLETIRSDDGWGWVYMVLHGHYLDHLGVIEPWAATLRARQADGDPFVADPRPSDIATFQAADASLLAQFNAVLQRVPAAAWTRHELTPAWTLREHVAHIADWAEEGVRAIEAFQRDGTWAADPEEGIDAWNERQVSRSADEPPERVLQRFEREYERMRAAVGSLSFDDVRSPDGWCWTYDCLYGHLRKHLALVGPWCATVDWPEPEPA
jgi:hypothetical protein